MIFRTLAVTLLLSLPVLPAAGQSTLRKTIVVPTGEQVVYSTQAQIATLASPAGTNQPPNQIVKFDFEQYDRNVLIQGVKPGEVKLLVEGTDERIGEVVTVVVVDPKVAERYRFVVGSLAGIEGISADNVHVAGGQVVVAGTVYSVADLNRCIALESQMPAATPQPRGKRRPSPPAPSIACLVNLSPAVAAVFPQQGYVPRVNLALNEVVPAGGAVSEATERQTSWNAVVRLGQVPVVTLASPSRAQLVSRVADFARKLSKAVDEWKTQAASNRIYPTTFQVRSSGAQYNLGMTWKFDQGRFGDLLLQMSPNELQASSVRSGGGSDRLVQWWAALLQDAFRLYFMALRPAHTGTALVDLYQGAVRLAPGAFERASAPVAVARSYYASTTSTGRDPFAELLVTPPADFQPPAIAP